MIKATSLDGLVVRGENFGAVRVHAPRWWRVDRHVAWLLTPKARRSTITIRFLGNEGKLVARELRAIAE